jgi:hypothetical protein
MCWSAQSSPLNERSSSILFDRFFQRTPISQKAEFISAIYQLRLKFSLKHKKEQILTV